MQRRRCTTRQGHGGNEKRRRSACEASATNGSKGHRGRGGGGDRGGDGEACDHSWETNAARTRGEAKAR